MGSEVALRLAIHHTSIEVSPLVCASPVHAGHRGSGRWATLRGRGSGTWATVVRLLGDGRPDHFRGLLIRLLLALLWLWVVAPGDRGGMAVLVELGLVDQRHRAVLEVLEGGLSVVEVARRFGVVRQTVHGWLRDYARDGIMGPGGPFARSRRRVRIRCAPAVEARVVSLRREHPGRGGRRRSSMSWAGKGSTGCRGGRRSIGRLVRHGLIDPQAQEAAPVGLQAVGAVPADGVVADGHHRRGAPGGRVAGVGGDRPG